MFPPTTTRQWLLTNKPTSLPVLSGPSPTFTITTKSLPTLTPNQVLLKLLYIANDPAQRGWISANIDPARLYLPPVPLNAPMHARGIVEVIESTSEKFEKGQLVVANVGWSEYMVQDASQCTPIQPIEGLSVTHFLGALGLTGLTAYYGIKVIVGAGAGETVVVSGAAGATGSMVVQIARKMLGCKRVIGIAGTDAKCRWVEELGADTCLNYKNPDFEKKLVEATDGYVEVYFDNVGGEILDLMLTRMKRFGRIAACGAVSEYNSEKPRGLKNYFEVVSNRIQIRGFIILDFMAEGKAEAAVRELIAAVKEGRISVGDENQTVVETSFEDVPKTWMRLFEGANTGKLITKLI